MLETVACNSMVARDITLPLDRDEAWACLTEPEQLEDWFAERAELDLREGGSAVFTLAGGERRRGVVEEVVPGERLAFWWWEPSPEGDDAVPDAPGSRVEFVLEAVPGGTRITVREAATGPLALAG
jgi:uncharacterized protein YndB with AHSA1/START domain